MSKPMSVEAVEDKEKEYKDRIVIRSYSSMILFIPSFLTALICGIVQLILNRTSGLTLEGQLEGHMNIIGTIFFVIFVLNFFLIAFEFSRARTVILILAAIIAVGALLLINAYTGFLTGGGGGTSGFSISLYLSTEWYFAIAAILLVIIALTWIGAFFDYHVIEGNELLHHRGWGADVERFPATNMGVVKEIPDLVEYLFFRSGTLVLSPPRTDRAIVLKNVFRITKKITQMNEILGRLKVDVD